MHESNRRVICQRADLDVWQYFNTADSQSQAKFGSRIMHIRARAREKRISAKQSTLAPFLKNSALFSHNSAHSSLKGKFNLPPDVLKKGFPSSVAQKFVTFRAPVVRHFRKVNLIYPPWGFPVFFALGGCDFFARFFCAPCTILNAVFLHP